MPGSRHESGILCKTHKIYSLTCDEYEELWARCGGKCESCGRGLDQTKRDHAIDHDHRYGDRAVRGIVCWRCNGYLARLETPRLRPVWTQGPGRMFSNYLSRAWFTRHLQEVGSQEREYVNHAEFRVELRDWDTYNKHLYSDDPKAALIPTDGPTEIAKILRREMSPQSFASLVRILNREAQIPKQVTDEAA